MPLNRRDFLRLSALAAAAPGPALAVVYANWAFLKHRSARRADYAARRLGDLKALMAQGFGDGAAHPPQNYNLGSG